MSEKGNLDFSHVLDDGLLGKVMIVSQKKSKKLKYFTETSACLKRRFSGNCPFKIKAGRVLAESLHPVNGFNLWHLSNWPRPEGALLVQTLRNYLILQYLKGLLVFVNSFIASNYQKFYIFRQFL